jgi:hypothetical protein
MFRRFYLLYGFLTLGTAAFGQYRGWSLDTVNQLKNVPKSVRDNPGSFRSAMSSLHWSSRLSEYSSSSSRSS